MPHTSEQISPEIKSEAKAIHPGAYLYWNAPPSGQQWPVSGQFHQWNHLFYVKTIRFGVFWLEAAAAELEFRRAGSQVWVSPPVQGTRQVSPGEDGAILQEVTHTTTPQVGTSSAPGAPAVAPHQTVQGQHSLCGKSTPQLCSKLSMAAKGSCWRFPFCGTQTLISQWL